MLEGRYQQPTVDFDRNAMFIEEQVYIVGMRTLVQCFHEATEQLEIEAMLLFALQEKIDRHEYTYSQEKLVRILGLEVLRDELNRQLYRLESDGRQIGMVAEELNLQLEREIEAVEYALDPQKAINDAWVYSQLE